MSRALEDVVCERVRDWIRREGPRVQYDDGSLSIDHAALKIVIYQREWDEENRVLLQARFEEESIADPDEGYLLGTPKEK